MRKGNLLAAVTGASSGIGAVYARKLASEGYDLLLVARREDKLAEVAARIQQEYGVRAATLKADLASLEEIQSIEERLASESRLRFLVNNAGFGLLGSFIEGDIEEQDRMHRVHVTATLRLTRAALRVMVPAREGAIVNVSSVAAFTLSPGNVSYGATKAWINAFTEGVYLELRHAGVPVRVQALCPGFTRSEFHRVMNVDMSYLGPSWWMSADEVVGTSLDGLRRNRLYVIPGARYRAVVGLMRWSPRWLRHLMVGRGARKMRPLRLQQNRPGPAHV